MLNPKFPGFSMARYGKKPSLDATKKFTNQFPVVHSLSTASGLASVVGFFSGGTMLLYDSYKKFKNNNKPASQNNITKQQTLASSSSGLLSSPATYGSSPSPQSQPYMDKDSDKTKFGNAAPITTPQSPSSSSKKDEMQGFSPETPIGKVGLRMGKFAVFMSGFAGMFNGWSTRLPLMTLGEAGVAGSSPWSETPLGLGMFNFGLGTVFAARALDLTPEKKMNMQVLQSKKGLGKIGYVIQNATNNVKSLFESTGLISRHALNLLKTGKPRQEAVNFMRHELLHFRHTAIQLTEEVDHLGKPLLKVGMKDSPHFMSMASLILMLGGAGLTIGSVIKHKLTQQVGFRTAAVGGSLDNIGLAKQGITKMSIPGTKLPGSIQALAGFTILPGQQWANVQWGRAMMWAATGFLFTTFSIENNRRLLKDLEKMKEPAREISTGLVRQWEMNLNGLLHNKKIFPNKTVFQGGKDSDGVHLLTSAIGKSQHAGDYGNALQTLKDKVTESTAKTLTPEAIETLHKNVSKAFVTNSQNKDFVKQAVERVFSRFEEKGQRHMTLAETEAYQEFKKAATGEAGDYAIDMNALRRHSEGGAAIVDAVQQAVETINSQPRHTARNWTAAGHQTIERAMNKGLHPGIKVTTMGQHVSAQGLQDTLKQIEAENRMMFPKATVAELYKPQPAVATPS
jgi:hypothetical protein